MISVRNPHDHSIGQVPEEAFESHWRHLGWERVSENEVAVLSVVANVTDESVTSLDSLSHKVLLTAAERAGVKVRKNAKKDTIIEQLREAVESGEVIAAAATSVESQEG